jgi:hypothetical protein
MAVKLPSIQAQHLANEQEVYEEHKQTTEIKNRALLYKKVVIAAIYSLLKSHSTLA